MFTSKEQEHTMGKTKKKTHSNLVITKQPPQYFANQEGGKKHGFLVAVKMHNPCQSAILKVELRYEDGVTRVPETNNKKRQPHKILQLLKPAEEFDEVGETRVVVRINDVSRNHRGRLFCLHLSVINQGVTTASVNTRPIKVVSKMPKHTRPRSEKSPTSCAPVTPPPQKRLKQNSCVFVSPGADWNKSAYKLLKSLQYLPFGYGPSHDRLMQCSSCSAVGKLPSLQHEPDCPHEALLREFEHRSAVVSSESGSECTPSLEEQYQEISVDEFQGCSARDLTEEFEASCLLPLTQVDSDSEQQSNAEKESSFYDSKALEYNEMIYLADPASLFEENM